MRNVDTVTTAILENSSVPFVALDSEMHFIYVNHKAEELLQKPKTELLGKNFRDEFPDEVLAPFYAAYQKVARSGISGTPIRFEAPYGPLNAWLELHVYPSDAGVSVYFQELGNRNQDAETLQSSQQRFRAVWQASADALALSDAEGTVLDVNPAYVELYGYTYDEVVGHNFAIIFPEQAREYANQQYRETFKSPQVPAFESVIPRPDGSEIVVEARVDFIEERGQRVAMLSTIRDVTERVRQAEALRESEERFRKTFDGAPIGMALVGLDLKPFRVNSALCELLGYSEQELTSMTFVEFTHPEDVEADLKLAGQILQGEIPSLTVEKRYLTKNQDIVWAQLSVALMRDKVGNIVYGLSMMEDITDRKRAEEERSLLLAKEHEARTLAERAVRTQEELLSLVSHDLRNPVAVVKGVTQLIERRIARGNPLDLDQLSRDLTKLSEAADRMDKFIEDLSTPQHIQPNHPLLITPERVDLVALVRRVTGSHRQRTEHRKLVVEADNDELVGVWDPARLEQVLDNLITNAVKYSPQVSVVKIGVGYETQSANEVRGGAAGDPDAAEQVDGDSRCAVLTVQDEGMGIPAQDLPHIFEWYRRGANVKDIIQGTGVGLAGARQIVDQHGGRITAESQEGIGSTFTVRLPLNSSL
ncbi:MAG: PAS domain S-box protein [Chloroflexia bacterium]